MIVDGETYELVNAIESLLEEPTDGEIKPELHGVRARDRDEPAPDAAQAGAQLRALRAQVRAAAERRGPDHRLGRHASVRDVGGPAHRRAPALPRPRLLAALRRAPGADLRDARPRRASTTPTRPSTSPTGCASTCRCSSPCQRELAVLARGRDRARVDADADLPRLPARRRPARVRRLGRLRARDRVHGRQRRDGGLHLPLVRRAPASRTSGRSRSACATARRASSTRSGWPRSIQAMVKRARRALRLRRALAALPVADARREQVARRPPRARRRARRSAVDERVATKALAPGSSTGCATHARDLGSEAELEAVEDLIARGNGAARQVVVYEANHDLARSWPRSWGRPVPRALSALVVALVVLAVPAATAVAQDQAVVDRAAQALARDPVFQDPDAERALSSASSTSCDARCGRAGSRSSSRSCRAPPRPDEVVVGRRARTGKRARTPS